MVSTDTILCFSVLTHNISHSVFATRDVWLTRAPSSVKDWVIHVGTEFRMQVLVFDNRKWEPEG
jgi:hypothetical protein